jgi:YidC/Oxa1 family membrane protein insertase
MRRMQVIAPKAKELQQKYKDDPQRFQRETMRLYKEEGVNPFSSCLPFLLQFPFFIAIYSLLRGSGFKDDVQASGDAGSLLISSVVENPKGAELIVLIVLFVVTTTATFLYTMTMTPTANPSQRYLFMILPLAIVPFIATAPAGPKWPIAPCPSPMRPTSLRLGDFGTHIVHKSPTRRFRPCPRRAFDPISPSSRLK